jgi:hypothetical protein
MVKKHHKILYHKSAVFVRIFGPEIEQCGKCHQTDLLHIEEIINRYNAEKSRTEAELRGEEINEDFIHRS